MSDYHAQTWQDLTQSGPTDGLTIATEKPVTPQHPRTRATGCRGCVHRAKNHTAMEMLRAADYCEWCSRFHRDLYSSVKPKPVSREQMRWLADADRRVKAGGEGGQP